MTYPPGDGKSGPFLMQLWRDYLEQYAEREGDVESQIIAAASQSVEILAALSRILDGEGRYKDLIDQRLALFRDAVPRAHGFGEHLLNATFSIYNNLNTLSHQCTEGNAEAAAMIGAVDEQVRLSTESSDNAQRSAAALRACFPLLGLMTIALDRDQAMTPAIRKIEQRFASGANAAASEGDHLIHALYRIVEMMQVLALETDSELRDQIHQIAARFKEEDESRDPRMKLRNGFCRFFELAHLWVTHVDAMLCSTDDQE